MQNLFSRKTNSQLLIGALIAGTLSVISVNSSSAHGLVDATNISAAAGTVNGSLLVATKLATAAVSHSGVSISSGHADARSVGLFYKDTTSATAQTATMVAGGVLSLYANVSTTVAISAAVGTNAGAGTVATATAYATNAGLTLTPNVPTTAIAFTGATSATTVALLYTAPATAGTVVISLFARNGAAATAPSSTDFRLGSKVGEITVTVLLAANLSRTHSSAGSTSNLAVTSGATNASLITATATNTGGGAVAATAAAAIEGTSVSDAARSTGLLSKDSSMGTAQTATMLTSGRLSLYTTVSTTVAFTSSGGSFTTTTAQGSSEGVVTVSDPAKSSLVVLTAAQAALGATTVATIWTAPSTVGTYTVSMTVHNGTTGVPTLDTPTSGTLGAQITVTVVAASTGGTYSAVYSGCFTKTSTSAIGTTAALSADSTSSSVNNGLQWYVGFALRDGYNAALPAGNIVVSATASGIVSLGADGSAVGAGTGSTVVEASTGAARQVRIDQPTAGAPLTTTVTISYNGTVVCTKTVKILGAAATIEISKVATVDLGGNTADSAWLDEGAVTGVSGTPRSGHFFAVLKDSAGNIVHPATADSFSMDPATTTTTVTALGVNANYATSTSSTSLGRFSIGTFTCGPTAGESAVKLRHTTAATGVTITSPAFTARCADDPYTYTASFDKASYTQGEIATLTVKFLDSKGFAANSVDSAGAVTMVLPFMTLIDATGSATMLTDAKGVKTYTMTVGTTSGVTAGTYTGIVDFTTLTAVAATKATPTYKISTGTTDVTFTEVLKSVVALIASINKQIQALQKLILKR